MIEKPLVAVRILTYNHESFISQALESVLSQKTSFPFIVILSDDCSTDRTTEICQKFKSENPQKIQLLVSEKNNIKENSRRNFEACRASEAKYIALLEGDDYWTNTLKLQKQVDFLEKNENYVICAHRNIKIDEMGKKIGESPVYTKNIFSQNDIAFANPISTVSVVFRAQYINFPTWVFDCMMADWAFYMHLTNYGDAYIMPDMMAAYRRHSTGIWTVADKRLKLSKTKSQLILYTTIFPQYKQIFLRSLRHNSMAQLYWSKFEINKMLHCLFLIIITPKSEITIRDFFYKIRNRKLFNDLK